MKKLKSIYLKNGLEGLKDMKFWAVVPSRFGSTRFPGKPLAMIAGVPLLQRVVEQIRQVADLKRIIVATDNSSIQNLCQKINVDVVMTDSDLVSGTDRIYQAVLKTEQNVPNNHWQHQYK